MPDIDRSEQLDEIVDAVLSGREHTVSVPETLGDVVRIAEDLRGLPRDEFRARLRAELEGRSSMTTTKPHFVPQGLGTVTPYLIVRDAEAALSFYRRVFGATEMMRHVEGGRVVHAKMLVGSSAVEMGEHSDVRLQDAQAMPQIGMHMYVEDVDALFERAVDAGVEVVRPVEEQPYGDREASIADPFGIIWFIATHVSDG